MDAALFMTQHALRKFESECATASMRVGHARTVSEVVRAADVNPPAWLRSVARRQTSMLNSLAERAIQALLDAQVKELAALDADACGKRLQQLRQDWDSLRGHYPRLAVQAQRLLEDQRRALRARTNSEPPVAGASPSP